MADETFEPLAALPVSPADEPITDMVAVEAEPRFWLVRWITSSQLKLLLLVVLYVAVQPPEKGLGIDLCTLHRTTGAPCPGCGMTRSGANLMRGAWDVVTGALGDAQERFRLAFRFHPLGYIFIPVLLGFAGLSLLPLAWRQAVARNVSRHERRWRVSYLVVIWGFLIYGVVRWIAVMAGAMAFPAEWP